MEKVYFNPGDLVRVKHGVPHKPIMVVEEVHKVEMEFTPDTSEGVGKVRRLGQRSTGNRLLGIECYWFTKDGFLQKKQFNSKDLEHVD